MIGSVIKRNRLNGENERINMNFLSLFTGIGGFDLAFGRAGMACVGMCEIDKKCQELLKHKFPGVPIYSDVREVGNATHRRGTVDLICGGFPCQDLSIAGKRAGLVGERSGLWFEFARIIDELEPGWVVIENVPGLLSSNRGEDFAVIIQWLAERGYGVVWRVLDAQYFGVAQRRRRVFIVGSLGNGSSAEVLFEREGMSGDPPARRKAGERIAVATLGHSKSNGLGVGIQNVSNTLEGTSSVNQAICMSTGQANAEIVNDGEPSLNAVHEQPIVATSWTLRGGKDGGGSGNNVPFVGIRRLTPTECERLQGFPDGWTDGQANSTRYRQIGNAIAVPVVEWIGRRINPDGNRLNTEKGGWGDSTRQSS